MRERTIASHFVRAALRGAERQGHDCTPLLRQLSIQPALLDEPRARVAPEQFARLVQRACLMHLTLPALRRHLRCLREAWQRRTSFR